VANQTTPADTSEMSDDRIEFFFDPLCPWAWITSRLVHEVSDQTGMAVTWRLISLALLNESAEAAEPTTKMAQLHRSGFAMLRVAAAVARDHDNEAVGRLYTELGTRLHTERGSKALWDGGTPDQFIVEAIEAAGLPAALAEAATDESLDTVLRSETDDALSRTGDDVGTPIITFDLDDVAGTTYFGPVINRIPRGEEALAIWSAVRTLALTPGVAEIKRTNRGTPEFD